MESISEHYELCPYCDTVVKVGSICEGSTYRCPKCHETITDIKKSPIIIPFIYAITSLFLYICSEILPFLSIMKLGNSSNITLMETVTSMFIDNYEFLSIFIYCNMQLFPLLCILCVIYSYACILLNKKNQFTIISIKSFFLLKEWSMVEVFLIAALVSMIKLVSMVELNIGNGFICFCLFICFYIKTVNSVDKVYVWSKIIGKERFNLEEFNKYDGEKGDNCGLILCKHCNSINYKKSTECSYCESSLKKCKNLSLQKCLSLSIAAAIMLIPANLFPIMITSSMGNDSSSTIFEGIIYMWGSGSYFVAFIIFIASVMVPITKIIILLYLCYCVKKHKNSTLKLKTKMYGLTEFIGKWSMVDVFVVAILSSLIKMGTVLSIYPGIAVLSFCATVILTMLAANSFDPRDIWLSENYDD